MKKAQVDITKDVLRLDGAGLGFARAAGAIGAAALLVSFVVSLSGTAGSEAFLRGYLVNYAYFVSIALGAMFFVLIQHATRAGWSVVVRRFAENLTMAMPWLALLGAPVVIMLLIEPEAVHKVFPWTNPKYYKVGSETYDAIIVGKSGYLNTTFFAIRFLVYAVLWIVIARFYYKSSVAQDQSGDPDLTMKMQWWSYLSLFAFALTTTFFSFDFMMSLEPHWFSTIFGVYYFAGGALAAFALMVIMMLLTQLSGRLKKTISTEHYHDVGKLVFAFIVFWAYLAFSQYMLIWYANIPEETLWYVVRQKPEWIALGIFILFGHFVVPFLLLISRRPKRNRLPLALMGVWVLIVHWFDMAYLVLPRYESSKTLADAVGLDLMTGVQSLLCLIGIGGVMIWAVVTRMNQATLLPERDPRLSESLEFENI